MCTCEPDAPCYSHSRVNRIRYPKPNRLGLTPRTDGVK